MTTLADLLHERTCSMSQSDGEDPCVCDLDAIWLAKRGVSLAQPAPDPLPDGWSVDCGIASCPFRGVPHVGHAETVSSGNGIDADHLGPDDHGHTGRLWCDPCVGHGVMLEQGIHRCANPVSSGNGIDDPAPAALYTAREVYEHGERVARAVRAHERDAAAPDPLREGDDEVRLVTRRNAHWLATLLSRDPEAQAWAEDWFRALAQPAPDPLRESEPMNIRQMNDLLDAAKEVVRLGNQPGFDDDEWEQAITELEAIIATIQTTAALRAALEAKP